MTMTTIERVVALQRVPMFADVPGRTLAAVAQRAVEMDVADGVSIIVEGTVEDHLFVGGPRPHARAPGGTGPSPRWAPARPSASSPRSFRSRAPHR